MKKSRRQADQSKTMAKSCRPIDNGADVEDSVRCYQLALRYLGSRQRSEIEVRRYLDTKRIFNEDVIESVIDKLKSIKLLDDRLFAESWKNDRLAFKPRSRSAIRRELVNKGVDVDVIEEATSGVDDLETALLIAQKRAHRLKQLEYPDFYRRLAGYLGRRGYSGEVINTTIKKVWKT
jgi:regulatory protein